MEKHSNLDITSRKLKTDGSTATKRVLVEQGSAVVVQLKEPAPRKMEEPAAATEGPSNTRKIKTQQLRATRNGPGSILALHKKQQEGVVNSDRNQEVSIRVDDDDDEEEELLQQHLPKNMHKNYGFECAEKFDMSKVHPATFSLFDMVFGYTKGQRNTIGHRQYSGSMNAGVQLLSKIQSCNYAALQRFQQLAEEYNITRWSAHGGTLMAAVCHRSMNPWDDDIDFTVSDCAILEKIHANGGNVTAKYPEIPLQRHTAQGWVGKLIDDDWILIKAQPGRKNSWFKLKAVAQARQFKGADLMGTDIMCLDKYISDSERGVMKRSGFRDYCKYTHCSRKGHFSN